MNIHGRLGRLAVSTDGGGTYTDVNSIEDANANGTLDEVETTTHDDGTQRTYIKGKRDLTIDLSLLFDEDDPGQNVLTDSYFGDVNFLSRFRMEEGAGNEEFLDLDSFITSYAEGSPNEDAATLAITVRVSGSHSPTPQ